MADAEKKVKISEFASIAGVSEDRARFFLESAAWNVEAAMAAFFEDDSSKDAAYNRQRFVNITPTPAVRGQPKSSGSHNTNPPSSSGSSQPSSASSSRAREPPRFGTIGSLRGNDDDSSSEEGQAFYAGGSEHGGGQQILGPKKKNRDIVTDLFKSVLERGAEVVEPSAAAAAAGTSQSVPFQGRAYRLGDTESASEVVGDEVQRDLRPQPVKMALKMWKNGFSIDDGPLRDFNTPENKQFLSDVRNGDVPRELVQMAHGGVVHLHLEDHGHEEYVRQPTHIRAFTGEGHRLGCPSDAITIANESARSAVGGTHSAAMSTSSDAQQKPSEPTVAVDPSQPTTSLQIRLADGTRLVSKFNHSHQIASIRQFIVDSRPQYATANFVLMTTFPNAELTDETLSLADAKLLNAVIVQRMK
jgi:UBX domain-containing protein 1